MKSFKRFTEDVAGAGPTNVAGSGHVAGIGVGLQGEPGVHPKKKKPNPILLPLVKRRPI